MHFRRHPTRHLPRRPLAVLLLALVPLGGLAHRAADRTEAGPLAPLGSPDLAARPAAGELLYEDDFSDPDSGWPITSGEGGSTGYVDGEYRIQILAAGRSTWVTGSPFFADMDASVTARTAGGEGMQAYGLLFSLTDIDNFYAFEVDPGGQRYKLERHTDAGWQELLPWTSSTHIQSGATANRLQVMRRGDEVGLWVNGQHLVTRQLPEVSYGRLGLLGANYTVTAGSAAFFDNIQVYAVGPGRAGPAYLPRAVSGDFTPGPPPPTALPPPVPLPGIRGRVTMYSEAPGVVPISLRQYDTTGSAQVAQTTTAADGSYLFANPPSSPLGKTYYVSFGPNNGDATRVFAWFGQDIPDYVAGTSRSGGEFDIGDILLASPDADAALRLPATFRWHPRPVTDTYSLRLFDPANTQTAWTTADLGHVAQATVNLPDGAQYQHTYGWTVRDHVGADSFGDAFYYSPFTFVQGLATGGRPEPAAGPLGLSGPAGLAGLSEGSLRTRPAVSAGPRWREAAKAAFAGEGPRRAAAGAPAGVGGAGFR
jgi:hypothetical protein